MSEWIETIEKNIRPFVKLLRDNGFNTECSCGHEMYIQCQFNLDGEIKRLHDLLHNNGILDYSITATIECIDGHWHSNLNVALTNSKKGEAENV